VSHTCRGDVDLLLVKLRAVVEAHGISFKEVGYTLRCSVADDSGKVRLAFNIEVVEVSIQKLLLVGLCRKRVKGDAWQYKKLCEAILADM